MVIKWFPVHENNQYVTYYMLVMPKALVKRPIGNEGLFHSLFHMILTLFGLAPPHAVTNGPPLAKRGYIYILWRLFGDT